MSAKRPGSRRVYFFGALWIACVAAFVFVLTAYSARAGEAAEAPRTWPADVSLQQEPGRFTLVMLVHPKCPCSRASIGELSELMVKIAPRTDAEVLFVRPEGFSKGWERTDLYRSAERIPGVRVHADPKGEMANRLGAKTSGQVVLYDPKGTLVFSGGVTPGRSHMGDNLGSQSIVSAVFAEEHSKDSAVYGCELFDEETNDGH